MRAGIGPQPPDLNILTGDDEAASGTFEIRHAPASLSNTLGALAYPTRARAPSSTSSADRSLR
eukprot:477098-Pyramimonas_sp.AAC.1